MKSKQSPTVIKMRLENVKRFITDKNFESAALFAGSVEQHYTNDPAYLKLIEAITNDDFEAAKAAINDLLFECSDIL